MNIFERMKFGKLLQNINIGKIDTLTGVEFEEFVADIFSYIGYKTSLTRASGDNGIDIVAKNRAFSIGIQTKLYYNHNVSNKAIQEVFSGKNYYKLDYAIAVSNWKFSMPALKVAKELNVAVIDRDMLIKILKNSRKDNKKLIKSLLEGCI